MEEKKQVAFLCHPYHRGGVTRWMADAAIAYAQKGFETYFLTLEPKQPFFSGTGRETMLELLAKKHAGIHILTLKVGRAFEFGTPEYCAFIYTKLFRGLPIGTPVILSDDSMVWMAGASLYNSFPLVGVLHADEAYYYDLGKKYSFLVDVLVGVSTRVSRKIAAQLPSGGHPPVYTIPCGINLPAVNKLSNKDNIIHLIYLGRITNYQKRVGDLVKIASRLKQNDIPFHLNIVGDGGEEKIELQEQFKKQGLKNEVNFAGWLPQQEVSAALNASDILLLTSDFEGTPIALMEALASGCGIVGTRVSGIEDYENNPHSGQCFRVYDIGAVDDAVTKIREIANVPMQQRQNAARAIAETQFSMEVCLQRYSRAIAQIPPRVYIKPVIKLSPAKIITSHIISFGRYLKVKRSQRGGSKHR